MTYDVNYVNIMSFTTSLGASCSAWMEMFDSVRKGALELSNTALLQGNTAERMKTYMANVQNLISLSMISIAGSLYDVTNAYFAKYCQTVDTNTTAQFNTSTLESCVSPLQNHENAMIASEANVNATLNSISDLISLGVMRSDDTQIIGADMRRIITTLVESTTALETTSSQNDFVLIDETIDSLYHFIDAVYSNAKNFSCDSSVIGTSYNEFATSLIKLYDSMQARQGEFDAANSNLQARIEEYQAIEEAARLEREQKAAIMMAAVTAVVVVAGAAVTVFTAGAGAPVLVAAVSGCVSGAIIGGTNEIASQYVANDKDGFDWSEIGKEALIGGITGAVTGAIGGSIGVAFKGGKLAMLANSSKGTLQGFGLNVTYGIVKETTSSVVTNAAGRFTEASLDKIIISEPGTNPFEAIVYAAEAGFKNALSPEKIGHDALTGGIKGGSEGIVSGFMDWRTGKPSNGRGSSAIDEYRDLTDADKRIRMITSAREGMITEVTYNAISRGMLGYIESDECTFIGKVEDGYVAAFDTTSVLTDAMNGSVSGYVGERKTQQAADRALEAEKQMNFDLNQYMETVGRKSNLPQSGGHWADPSKPGNSMWIPDDNELEIKYGVMGVNYVNNEPDFSPFEDKTFGHVYVDELSTERTGKDGTYDQAREIAARELNMTKDEVIEEMKRRGLTWHEHADRKTISAVPTDINRKYPHSGGISKQTQFEGLDSETQNRYTYQMPENASVHFRQGDPSNPAKIPSKDDSDAPSTPYERVVTDYQRVESVRRASYEDAATQVREGMETSNGFFDVP